TPKVVTAAKGLGDDIHILVAGSGCGAVAEQAAKLDGVAKVLVADDAQYANGLAEPLAVLVTGLMDSHDVAMGSATTVAKNFMPR
ncbi:MAG TPA: electron transfer flavoprotein subunit alpha, partial [Alphaproteobacteria bacterium]|nr:electron transfer flavoprotein subunit alpha [Alphaproteobacteria bacterium]